MDRMRSDGADGDYGSAEPVVHSVRETAKLLGIGETQAYNAVHAGEIPSLKIGARFWVPAWFIRQLREGDAA